MELQQIQKTIDRALADGKLSRDERDIIFSAIYGHKKVTPQESKLWRVLQQKIWYGEVQIDS
ncbi:hypothetical protein H6G50_03960 [Oscillatoria sp. FACHB-1406]|nr:hypothetical protein [Oscillatoria sp. FACHB-1406]